MIADNVFCRSLQTAFTGIQNIGASRSLFLTGHLFYSGQHETVARNISQWEIASGHVMPASVSGHYDLHQPLYNFVCKRCGYSFFSPTAVGTDAYYSAITQSDYYEGDRDDFRYALKQIIAMKPKSLLEYGSGMGAFLQLLKLACPQIECSAVEKSKACLNALAPLATVYTDQNDISNKFDVICMFQLLEHVEDPFSLVTSCRALLNPGGRLFLSVPNYSGFYRFFSGSWTETPPHHLTRWTDQALTDLLHLRGFANVKIRRLPMQAVQFHSYVPAIWYILLRHLHLEGYVRITNFSWAIEKLIKLLHIKRLPFFSMFLLAEAKVR